MWKVGTHPYYSYDDPVMVSKEGYDELFGYDFENLPRACVNLLADAPEGYKLYLYKTEDSIIVPEVFECNFAPFCASKVDYIMGLISSVVPPRLVSIKGTQEDSSDVGAASVLGGLKTFDSLGLEWLPLSKLFKRGPRQNLNQNARALLCEFDKVIGGRVNLLSFQNVTGHPRKKTKESLAKEWLQLTLLDARPSKFPEPCLHHQEQKEKCAGYDSDDSDDDFAHFNWPGREFGISKVNVSTSGGIFPFDAYMTGEEAGFGEAAIIKRGILRGGYSNDDDARVKLSGMTQEQRESLVIELDDYNCEDDFQAGVLGFSRSVIRWLDSHGVGHGDSSKTIRPEVFKEKVLEAFEREAKQVQDFLSIHRPDSDQAYESIVPVKIYPKNSQEELHKLVSFLAKIDRREYNKDNIKKFEFKGIPCVPFYGKAAAIDKVCDGYHMSFDGEEL
jgi:hypothetical protein